MEQTAPNFRREEILSATYTALKKYGLASISYDLIAEQAQTSRQLVRHYYPDAEALMVDVVASFTEQYQSLVMDNVVSGNATQRLSTLMDFFLGSATEQNSPTASSSDSLFALAVTSHRVRDALHTTHQVLADTFATELLFSYPMLDLKTRTEIGFLFVVLQTGHWRLLSSLGFSQHYASEARLAMEEIIDSYLKEAKARKAAGRTSHV
jgi:AcrR family transcriptional regulator